MSVIKKKIVLLVAASMMLASLVGCNIPTGTETKDSGTTSKIYNNDVYEFVDPDTGVHYWIYSHSSGYGGMGGMTPRLNSDASIMVDK